MSINLKLQLTVFIAIVVTAISLVIVNITSLNDLLKENIKVYKKDVIKSKIDNIEDATKFATKIVKSYYNNVQTYTNDFLKKNVEALLSTLNATYIAIWGEYSEDEIREILKSIVAKTRYGKNGYFWINDTNHVMIMHPIKSSLNGKNLSNLKDANGVYFFKEFVRVAITKGGGIVRYYWPKPGSNKSVAKISHVRLFKPWG